MTVRVVPGQGGGKKKKPPPPRPNGNGGGGGGGGSSGHWTNMFTSTNGSFAATVHNVVVILQYDPAWEGVLQFDEFAQRVVYVRPMPSHEYGAKSYTPPRNRDGDEASGSQLRRYVGTEVGDEDCYRAAVWIERVYRIKISSGSVHEAMEIVARAYSVHPVRQFLSSLVWDGVPRLGKMSRAPGTNGPNDPGLPGSLSWLSRYMGADDTDYTRNVGRWWLISAIARIFVPGCQAQHMMVLEGDQGLGKSRALRALADPWFSEDLPDTTSKDSLQQLLGVWMMEVAEMDAINKGGINAAKRFVSKAVDRFRPPYARRVRDFPRQIVFCGTTNQSAYLTDTTGNRRYWPVMTRAIDVDLLRAERSQLLAEAVLAFQAGEDWWPAPEQVAVLKEQQDERVEQDAWFGPVSALLRNRHMLAETGVTVADVLSGLQIDKGRWGPTEERRAIRLLLQLGRHRVRRLYDGILQFVYDLPAHATKPPDPPPAPAPEPPPEQGVLWGDDEEEDWR